MPDLNMRALAVEIAAAHRPVTSSLKAPEIPMTTVVVAGMRRRVPATVGCQADLRRVEPDIDRLRRYVTAIGPTPTADDPLYVYFILAGSDEDEGINYQLRRVHADRGAPSDDAARAAAARWKSVHVPHEELVALGGDVASALRAVRYAGLLRARDAVLLIFDPASDVQWSVTSPVASPDEWRFDRFDWANAARPGLVWHDPADLLVPPPAGLDETELALTGPARQAIRMVCDAARYNVDSVATAGEVVLHQLAHLVRHPGRPAEVDVTGVRPRRGTMRR